MEPIATVLIPLGSAPELYYLLRWLLPRRVCGCQIIVDQARMSEPFIITMQTGLFDDPAASAATVDRIGQIVSAVVNSPVLYQ